MPPLVWVRCTTWSGLPLTVDELLVLVSPKLAVGPGLGCSSRPRRPTTSCWCSGRWPSCRRCRCPRRSRDQPLYPRSVCLIVRPLLVWPRPSLLEC